MGLSHYIWLQNLSIGEVELLLTCAMIKASLLNRLPDLTIVHPLVGNVYLSGGNKTKVMQLICINLIKCALRAGSNVAKVNVTLHPICWTTPSTD